MGGFDYAAISDEARRRWLSWQRKGTATGEMLDYPFFVAQVAFEAGRKFMILRTERPMIQFDPN